MVNKIFSKEKILFIQKAENNEVTKSIDNCKHSVGDKLLLKESWAIHPEYGNLIFQQDFFNFEPHIKWKSPILLKKENIRIVLEITKIEIKKLNEITELDAKYNGNYKSSWPDPLEDSDPETGYFPPTFYTNDFMCNWESKYGQHSSNCEKTLVWLIHFDTIINNKKV